MAELIWLTPEREYLIRAREAILRAGDEPRVAPVLAVRGGKIHAVLDGTRPLPPSFRSPAWQEMDLGESFLFPALVDSHLHLGIGSAPDPEGGVMGCLNAGLAAVRDGGDRGGSVLKSKIPLCRMGLEIRAAGKAVFPRGGYGSFLGQSVRDMGEFRRVLSELVRLKADFLKIVVTGVVDFAAGGLSQAPGFDLPTLKGMVRAAWEEDLRVMAHANSDGGVHLAVAAGVHSVEHGYLCTRESLSKMADGGVYWVPTLLPVFRLGHSRGFRAAGSPEALENLRRIYACQEENVALAHAMGVRICAGTDAGAPGIRPGLSLYDEMGLLARCGLSPEAALRSGSLHGAEILSPPGGGGLGCLEPGRKAHFLALSRSASSGLWGPGELRFIVGVRLAEPGNLPETDCS